MILHRLRVEGFKMIGDALELEFPETGRVGILGPNESGKSTLLESIKYTLYGLERGATAPREDVVTWWKERAKLEVEFSSGEHRYILTREIGAKTGHRAKLIPIIDGRKDAANTITSVTEILNKVEGITGMDRDSFTKLIYIRQKDLDALKELVKAKREQLVNKVMGMEVFDEASRMVKEEVSEYRLQLLQKAKQLEKVAENKETYEKKHSKRRELEEELVSLSQTLERRKAELEEAKGLCGKYDWLFKYKSTNDLVEARRDELEQAREEQERLLSLRKDFVKYENALTKYGPRVEELQGLQGIYQQVETQESEIQRQIQEVKVERDRAVQESSLSLSDAKLAIQNLPKQKGVMLRRFAITALAGILSLLAGLLSLALIVLGIIVVSVAGYFLLRYVQLDRVLSQATAVQQWVHQIQGLEGRAHQTQLKLKQLKEKCHYETSSDVALGLTKLLRTVKEETGEETMEGLKALKSRLMHEIERIESNKPEQRLDEIRSNIETLSGQLYELEKSKPESLNSLQYEEEKHKAAKTIFERATGSYTEVEKWIEGDQRLLKQLEDDLANLKPDYELFPILSKEVEDLKDKVTVLTMVDHELGETSKELRNKVIPQARYIVNQILPTLTDGRYSDFEITEDLKFKVHSLEAGGYKEREVFSGGTQDQFLIALRLAFTQSILDSRVMADKYTLLMDECISSSDETRKQGIFEVLDLMKGTFSQIFVIAHEDVSNLVDHHLVLGRNSRGYTEIRSRSW